MTKPEVSIIIPAYNAQSFLSETVNSVLAQTHADWELIIVNDGSTDGTLRIAHGFEDDRINQMGDAFDNSFGQQPGTG